MKSLSRVRFFAIPWIVAYQATPSMGFSKQEYWSGLPFPSPVGRKEHCKYHWCVWGVLTVSGPHCVCPRSRVCAFLVYTAQAPGCSAGELSKVGPGLQALPRHKPLRFRFSGTPQRHRLGWACISCPSQVQAAQATRCLTSILSQLGSVSYHLPGPSPSVSWVHHKSTISGVPCVSSGELISDCDPAGGCQPSRIPGRLR